MKLQQKALLVGINAYERMKKLTWCVNDARAMKQVLEFHEDRLLNFSCRLLLGLCVQDEETGTTSEEQRVTLIRLKEELEELFNCEGRVLFYFSGHAYSHERGVYLVTQEGTATTPGILLNELLDMANSSKASEVVLIIDSCFAGALGEPGEISESEVRDLHVERAYLRPGVTLLAASLAHQNALEEDGHGLFTRLVLGALKGGASDIRGQISTAAIYAYVEQALGPWDQRPIYKSNSSQFSSIRNYTPDITDHDLLSLPLYFPTPDYHYPMDPSYERTSERPDPSHVAIFKLFKHFQVARMLRPTVEEDLYFAAIYSHTVELTPLGQFYWLLATKKILGRPQTPVSSGRFFRPDPESVAKLFHDTYERLAPAYHYETRKETKVSWDNVPDDNRHLMIATVAEVLEKLFPPTEQTPPSSSPSKD